MRIHKKGFKYQVKDTGSNSDLNGQIIEFGDSGTFTSEVFDVLISRMEYLNELTPSREYALTITKLQEAQMWFNKRNSEINLVE